MPARHLFNPETVQSLGYFLRPLGFVWRDGAWHFRRPNPFHIQLSKIALDFLRVISIIHTLFLKQRDILQILSPSYSGNWISLFQIGRDRTPGQSAGCAAGEGLRAERKGLSFLNIVPVQLEMEKVFSQ